jgi:hypothetical protein
MATAEAFCGPDVPALSRGERVATQSPGEGVPTLDRAYPLAPTLSPWEREDSALLEALRTEQIER